MHAFNSFLADLQVWGTPDQVTAKLLDYVRRTDAGTLIIFLSFGGMSADEATANFELFSSEVLPAACSRCRRRHRRDSFLVRRHEKNGIARGRYLLT